MQKENNVTDGVNDRMTALSTQLEEGGGFLMGGGGGGGRGGVHTAADHCPPHEQVVVKGGRERWLP